MTAPWTPRERALREALEQLVGHIKPDEVEAYKELSRADGKPCRYPITVTDHAIIAGSAALADPPPPDPRDEALRLAEKSIRFASTRIWHMASCRLDEDNGIPCNCGQGKALDSMSAALAAIVAAEGEK